MQSRVFNLALILISLISGLLAMEVDNSLLNIAPSKVGQSAPYVPTSGTFKTLVIFIKFNDDNFDSPPLTDQWPSTLNTLPSWAIDIISPTVESDYEDPSLSGYFHTMSQGNYDLIGDVYPVLYIPLNNQSYYFQSSGRGIEYLTEEIFTELNQSIDYSQYDGDNDGYVDMIFLCFRNINPAQLDDSGYWGICSLTGFSNSFPSGSYLSFDGVKIEAGAIGSGTIQRDIYDPNYLSTIIHEFGHYLFGTVHFPGIGMFGVMDGFGTACMSSFERERLGWINIPVLNSAYSQTITLNDAFSSGGVYKVPISGTSSYYYIENLTPQNFYESDWQDGAGNLFNPGYGLLISKATPSYNSFSVNVQCADGLWDWEKSGSYYLYPFQQIRKSIFGFGRNEFKKCVDNCGTKKP